MGRRPTWYLWALAKIWRLSYIKPSVPFLGKFVVNIRSKMMKPEKFNISHLPVNVEIKSVNTPLPVAVLENIIRESPYRTIIRRCTCREAKNCQTHDMNIGCLHIGEATEEEDTNVAKHVTVDEAVSHLHKAVESGLIPFMGHAAGDNTIWNVSKDRPFLTVCFCCFCCCTLFYGYKYLPREAKATFHRLKGIEITVDNNKCRGCGDCAAQCFTGAISIRSGKSYHDEAVCKGCGHCAVVCSMGAVTVRVEDLESTAGELFTRIGKEVRNLPLNLSTAQENQTK